MPKVATVNPFAPDHLADPYEPLARLRDDEPVHCIRQASGLELWLVTSYEEGRAALLDLRLSNDLEHARETLEAAGIFLGDRDEPRSASLLGSDPPDHTRLRRLVVSAFTPRRVERLRPHVFEVARDLLEGLEGSEFADLVESFAVQLPMRVICELLGVPLEDRDAFRSWTNAMLTPGHVEGADERRVDGKRRMYRYLKEFVEARASAVVADVDSDAQPDLVTALIAASRLEHRLDEGELINLLEELLIGGYETVANQIGNSILALLRHPDQLRVLRERPELVGTAVDELVRYDGAVMRATLRVAVEDVQIGGRTIPGGSPVSIVLGSAGRDGEVFDAAGALDVRRPDARRHLGFGHGRHYCLGAALGRIEIEAALTTLLERFPDLELACPSDELRWRFAGILRALESLPVRLGAPAAPREHALQLRRGKGEQCSADSRMR